jgi:DNA-binding NtrC family response regulator
VSAHRIPGRSRALPEKRVLILDDPSPHMDAIRTYFERFEHGQRYTLHTGSTGAEAAAALRQARPDLILLDPQMTGLNGLALLKQVRALDSSIPMIVVTGKQPTGAVVEVLNAAVFAYVPKPCDFQQLEHLVALVFAVESRTAP